MYTGNGQILLWNSIGALVLIVWYGFLSFLVFWGLNMLGIYRVDPKLELMGLDAPYHKEPAYIYQSNRYSVNYSNWDDIPKEIIALKAIMVSLITTAR